MKLVVQNTSQVWGGNEKWLATLSAGLMSRGHEVVVSCAMGAVQQELASRGIQTTPFRPRGSLDFASGLVFAAWLRAFRPDVLLLTSWRPTTWATFAARAAGVTRVVMRLGLVRDFPRFGPRSLALRNIDALIVNSVEIRETWLRSARAFPSDRVHVILNGVKSRLAEKAELRQRLRSELGLPDKTILVGGAGHIAPRKGFGTLLRAFAIANVSDSRLAIIGEGEHRAELERLAAGLGIAGRVKWLGHRDDGAGAIAALDIFVLSSHNEGMANVMLEAMAGGTPVIAVEISGVRQAIAPAGERQPAGWMVQEHSPESFADAIREVADCTRADPSSVESRTNEAHWRAVNWFSPERMVEECEAVLLPAR